MWLALLLATADDTLDARGRRAALHELRQRLIPTEDTRGPPLVEVLLGFAERYAQRYDVGWARPRYPSPLLQGRAPPAGVGMSGVWTRTVQLWRAIRSNEGMASVPWAHTVRLAGFTHMDDFDHCYVSFPREDLDLVTGIALGPPTPPVRTEGDALLNAALRFWEAMEYNEAIHEGIAYRLPSMLDWVRAMHPSISSTAPPAPLWLDLVARSDAWHARFRSLDFGCALPDALVVIRWSDGWTLQRLTEKKDFAGEGTSMGHCVGGPDRGRRQRDGESQDWQRARDDTLVVLSLRDPDRVPRATVSVTRAGIYEQVQGPQNDALGPEAMGHLAEALYRMEAWGFTPVPRLGTPAVWTDDTLGQEKNLAAALREAYALQTCINKGMQHTGAFELAFERFLSGLLYGTQAVSRAKTSILRKAGLALSSPPPGLAAGAEVLAGVLRKDTQEELLVFMEPTRLMYLTDTNAGKSVVTPSLLEAVRAFTGALREAPDLSHLEVYPGTGETFNFAWHGLLLPIAMARELRVKQGLSSASLPSPSAPRR